MPVNIAIIGLGNIGLRHLQAVARVKDPGSVWGFDIRQEALSQAETFCRDNNLNFISLRLTNDFKELLFHMDRQSIVIVATTAKDRKELLLKVLEQKPLAVLAEKPLCQGVTDYKAVLNKAKKLSVPVYVHFSRRRYDFYQKIFDATKNVRPKCFTAVFSGGMCCNGIHLIDLAAWLMRAKSYNVVYSKKRKVFASKRNNYFDFSGDLLVRFDNGAMGLFQCDEAAMTSVIDLAYDAKAFKIFEDAGKMISFEANHVVVDSIEIPLVSQLTDKIMEDIYHKRSARLPTVQESYLAHSILFRAIRKNKLGKLNFT